MSLCCGIPWRVIALHLWSPKGSYCYLLFELRSSNRPSKQLRINGSSISRCFINVLNIFIDDPKRRSTIVSCIAGLASQSFLLWPWHVFQFLPPSPSSPSSSSPSPPSPSPSSSSSSSSPACEVISSQALCALRKFAPTATNPIPTPTAEQHKVDAAFQFRFNSWRLEPLGRGFECSENTQD